MLPDFIIGGTLPAGTGQLYGLLVQHPEIYLAPPMQPECNFFVKSGQYGRGIAHYEATWFRQVPRTAKAVGERSSLLLSSAAWAAARVAKHLPDVKLIFLFRNPVDRAYANYRFTALAGYEDVTFEEALRTETQRMREAGRDAFWREIQPHAYFHRGLYADQLHTWLEHVPASRMLLMRSDELLRDMHGALRKIYDFLGVDPSFVAAPFSDFSSPSVTDVKLQRRLRLEQPEGFDAAIQRLREGKPPETPIDEEVRSNVAGGYEPLRPAFRTALTDRYRDANLKLRPLVPFSITDWL